MNKQSSKLVIVMNEKGGVGKTTIAVETAFLLAKRTGKRILLIDSDPQRNASILLGIEESDGLKRLLINKEPIHRIIKPVRDNLCIVSTNHSNLQIQEYLSRHPGGENLLESVFKAIVDFDLIVVDSAPSIDWFQIRLLPLVNYLIIPTTLEHLSLVGVNDLLRTINTIKTRQGVSLFNWKVLPNKVEFRTRESRRILAELDQSLSSDHLLPIVPSDTRVREASARGVTVSEYSPNCPAMIGSNLNTRYSDKCQHYGGFLHVVEILENDLFGR